MNLVRKDIFELDIIWFKERQCVTIYPNLFAGLDNHPSNFDSNYEQGEGQHIKLIHLIILLLIISEYSSYRKINCPNYNNYASLLVIIAVSGAV